MYEALIEQIDSLKERNSQIHMDYDNLMTSYLKMDHELTDRIKKFDLERKNMKVDKEGKLNAAKRRYATLDTKYKKLLVEYRALVNQKGEMK